jgi:hypothetical protein
MVRNAVIRDHNVIGWRIYGERFGATGFKLQRFDLCVGRNSAGDFFGQGAIARDLYAPNGYNLAVLENRFRTKIVTIVTNALF